MLFYFLSLFSIYIVLYFLTRIMVFWRHIFKTFLSKFTWEKKENHKQKRHQYIWKVQFYLLNKWMNEWMVIKLLLLIIIWWSVTKIRCSKKKSKIHSYFMLLICYKSPLLLLLPDLYMKRHPVPGIWVLNYESIVFCLYLWVIYIPSVQEQFQGKMRLWNVLPKQKKKKKKSIY